LRGLGRKFLPAQGIFFQKNEKNEKKKGKKMKNAGQIQ
jgi:hypothetical protein